MKLVNELTPMSHFFIDFVRGSFGLRISMGCKVDNRTCFERTHRANCNPSDMRSGWYSQCHWALKVSTLRLIEIQRANGPEQNVKIKIALSKDKVCILTNILVGDH